MTTVKHLFVALILGLLAHIPCFGQGNTLRGSLLDEAGKGLAYANVLLLSSKDSALVKGASSDVQGHYFIEGIAPGTYLLQIRLLGYRTPALQRVSIEQENQQRTLPPLRLEPTEEQLATVEIKAVKPFIEQQADKTIINVENSIVSAGNTALEVLEKAPGVLYDRQNESLSIRGKQGVLVLIDGRQTFLPASEVVAMLQNMPAGNVASIEVMTNPPARYAAEGNAGLINIVLKKNREYGLNAALSSTLSMGITPKYQAGLNVNNRQERYNLFLSYNYANTPNQFTSSIVRRVTHEGQSTVLDQRREAESRPINHTVKVGSDLFLAKQHTLGFVLNSNLQQRRGSQLNTTDLRGKELQIDHFDETAARQIRNLATNVHYIWDLLPQKKQLSLDLDWVRYNRQLSNYYTHRLLDPQGNALIPEELLTSQNKISLLIYSFKANYTHAFSKKASLEGGVSLSNVPLQSALDFQELIGDSWVQDPFFSNIFAYDELIEAAYLNYKGSRGPWQVQAGLRGEYTKAKGVSEQENKVVDRSYLQVFPSLFLTRSLGETQSLQLSYSRRIDRPSYQELNPFIYFVSYYTYLRGNPFLSPHYTNNLQLSYTHPSGLILTGSFSRTMDRMTNLPHQDDATKIEVITPYNIDDYDNASLSAFHPLQLRKFWSATTNVNVFHNRFRYVYQGSQLNNRQTSLNATTTHTFSLGGSWKAEVLALYKSPMALGVHRTRSQWNIDAGLSTNLFRDKASVKLQLTDIFNTNRFRSQVQVQNMDMSFQNRWESRQLRLSLNYRMGNERVKVNQNRRTGAQEEQGRIGG